MSGGTIKYLFDLEIGDRFYCASTAPGRNEEYEVISPWGMSGIPYGFGFLGNTRKQVKENKVYAVETRKRIYIRVFETNAKVRAY